MTNLPSTNITRAHLADAVGIFLDLISEALLHRESVMISGFGKFIVLERAARKGRNVKLGVNVIIEPRLAIVFKPAPGLIAQLNNRSSRAQAPAQKVVAGA